MQPLHPGFVEQLLVANPNLTREILEHFDALCAAEVELYPRKNDAKIEAIRRDKLRILSEFMPNYSEVKKKWKAVERAKSARDVKPLT